MIHLAAASTAPGINFDAGDWVLIATAALTALLGFAQNRRIKAAEKRAADAEERKVELSAQELGFESTMRLTEYIDKRADLRVAERMQPVLDAQKRSEEREARRTGAISRMLRSIAEQLPAGFRLHLDPADVRELQDTIPPQWL